jgi:hypothetical protein
MTGLSQIKQLARKLSLGHLRKLDQWLHAHIRKVEEKACAEPRSLGKHVVQELALKHTTYRLEGIRCGKEKCKCASGKRHGPYWYSYSRVKDKVKSRYIGKKLPREVERALEKQKKE